MSTPITITGNTTREPALRFTSNGTAVVNFDVAVNSRRKDAAGNWVDGETAFYPVTVWGEQAEHVASSLTESRVAGAGKRGRRPRRRPGRVVGLRRLRTGTEQPQRFLE